MVLWMIWGECEVSKIERDDLSEESTSGNKVKIARVVSDDLGGYQHESLTTLCTVAV